MTKILQTYDILQTELECLKKDMESISGNWNGKESGLAEDRAMLANDILEKVKELEELLVTLEDF